MILNRILFLLILFSTFQNCFSQVNQNAKIESYLQNFQYDSAYITTQKAIKDVKVVSEEKADYYIKYSRILKSISKTDSCFYYLDKAEEFYKKNKIKVNYFTFLLLKRK